MRMIKLDPLVHQLEVCGTSIVTESALHINAASLFKASIGRLFLFC